MGGQQYSFEILSVSDEREVDAKEVYEWLDLVLQ